MTDTNPAIQTNCLLDGVMDGATDSLIMMSCFGAVGDILRSPSFSSACSSKDCHLFCAREIPAVVKLCNRLIIYAAHTSFGEVRYITYFNLRSLQCKLCGEWRILCDCMLRMGFDSNA